MSTTITGSIKTIATGLPGSNSFVRFILRGTGGNQPHVTGTAAVAPLLGGNGLFYSDLAADASGNVSGMIYSTRDATGLLGGEIELGGSLTSAYFDMVVYAGGLAGPPVSIHTKNTATIDISSPPAISLPVVVTAPTGDTTYLRTDAANSPVTGLTTFSAGIVSKKVNNIRFADQFASIQAAHDDLPSTGGMIVLPTGTTTVSSTTTISKPVTFRGHGRDSTIINDTRTTSDTFSVQSHRVTFQDLQLTRSGITAASGTGIHFGAFNDHAIVNCNIRDSYNGVVTDSGQNYLQIERSLIQANQNDGVQLNGPTWMYFNQMYFNAGNGMTVTQGGSLLASHGNEFYANRGRGVDYFGNGLSQSFHNGDIIDSNGSDGLFVQHMTQLTFVGGWIASSGVTFSGALGTAPSYSTPAAKHGAEFDNTVGAVIMNGNWIINNGGAGVFFDGTAQVDFSHNRVAGNNQNGAGNAAIAITDNGANVWASVTLSGNRVWDALGLASPVVHQETGLLLSGGASGFIEITGGDYTGNHTAALSDTSTATKKYIGAAGITDKLASLTLGSGSAITSSGAGGTVSCVIASGTSTLTANATLAATTSQTAITTTATGAATTDAIEWSYASAPGSGDALCILSAYPTSGNVNFVRANPTASSQNVSAIVINWRIVR